MNKKDLKKDTMIRIAIIIAILIVVNIISVKFFFRIDFTKNKSFTLSPVSKEMVKNLSDQVVVKAYISDNLPSPYNNIRRQAMDLLNDYKSSSGGNLSYEFFNPTGEADSALEKEAMKYGVPSVPIQNIEKDKAGYVKAYIGLVYLYKGKQELTQFIQPNDNLEYEISTKIRKISVEQRTKIGFLTGQGQYDVSKMQSVYKILQDQYTVVNVDVSLNRAVPDDVKLLVVMGPKQPLPENVKYMLDQFIMRGGNVAWLLNKVGPTQQKEMIIGDLINTNLDDMLISYGIKINNDLVRDLNCAQMLQPGPIEGTYIPLENVWAPVITKINGDFAAFNNLPNIVLPYCSSIDLNAANGKNLNAKWLLTSSEKSGTDENFFLLNFDRFKGLNKSALDTLFGKKELIVGAVYEGKFRSFYEGKTPPSDTAKESSPISINQINESQKESKMLAIGDADFPWEENRPPKENLVFFLDLVEYLSDDIGLSHIRNKESSESKIEAVSDATKSTFKYFNLMVPPLLIVLVGLYKWNKRKILRKSLMSN